MYHLSVIGSVGPPERYLDSIEGGFENIQLQTFFGGTEHIIVYAQGHSIFDKFTHLKNVKFIKETGKGVYNAGNQGIQASTTPIVTNGNIDDRRYPRANEIKGIQLKKNPDIGLVYNGLHLTDIENDCINKPKGRITVYKSLSPEDSNGNQECQCGPDPMGRKNLHNTCGGFLQEQFPVRADGDMGLKFSKVTQMMIIKEPLVLYYVNPKGESTSTEGKSRMIIETEEIRKIHGL